jgi:predicted transcriptional regulator
MKEQVKNYLKSLNAGKTPTQIGLALGKDYNTASSSVTNALKSLVNEGLVYKTKIDGKVLYGWVR